MQGQFYVLKNAEQAKAVFDLILESGFKAAKALKFSDYKPPKTNTQLAYAYSLINYIALAKSVSADEVKTDAKREWGVIVVSTSTITGERKAKLKSFSDYTKDELSAFISQAEHFCAENGIYYIPSK